MTNRQVLTIGIEIEMVRGVNYDLLQNVSSHFDSSVSTPAYRVHAFPKLQIPITEENVIYADMLAADSTELGTEVVSNILPDLAAAKDLIRNVLVSAALCGEPPYDPRKSIHIHIGCGYTLDSLKWWLRLGTEFESLLFHLSGLGNMFRGAETGAPYCTSFTSPPAVKSNFGLVRLIHVPEALMASTIDQFWNRVGMASGTMPGRYTPQRYMYLSLYNLLLKGTIEFRAMNYTPRYDWVISMVDLLREMARFTMGAKWREEEFNISSVHDSHSLSEHHTLLQKLITMVGGVEPDSEKHLHEILDLTPSTILPKKIYFSHKKNIEVIFEREDGFVPEQIAEEEVSDPVIVDSHLLEDRLNNSRSAHQEEARLSRTLRSLDRIRFDIIPPPPEMEFDDTDVESDNDDF